MKYVQVCSSLSGKRQTSSLDRVKLESEVRRRQRPTLHRWVYPEEIGSQKSKEEKVSRERILRVKRQFWERCNSLCRRETMTFLYGYLTRLPCSPKLDAKLWIVNLISERPAAIPLTSCNTKLLQAVVRVTRNSQNPTFQWGNASSHFWLIHMEDRCAILE